MTPVEREALRHFRFKEKARVTGRKMREVLNLKAYDMSKAAWELVDLGEDAFLENLRDRVISDNPEVLNRCPKCQRVPVTPRAKQCPWCFHDWHDVRS